jgi:crotonobetainyl-CoA:carnitine CoA-transferase CaiB-like acyl-CoA transferase
VTEPSAPTAAGPLAGLRILDLSRILAGPTCTQLLGDFGADVVKIERPGSGDDTRSWGPPFVRDGEGRETRESAYYLSSNRNKRSVAIDIAKPAGAALVRRMAAASDVLIQNFKVGGLAQYGLAYDDLKGDLPGLIYCSISGFGQTGPNAHRAGYDVMAQGYGGIMSLTGPADGEPYKVAVGIADVMCGMYAATAILAALRHRDATGQGQHIDVALVDAQIAWLINEGTNYLLTGLAPPRRGNQHPNVVPYQVFEAADGHVIVAVGNDAQFARFCRVIGTEGLADDPRFRTNQNRLRNREALIPAVEAKVATWRKDDLLRRLEAEGIPGGPIHTLPEVFATDQVAARGMRIVMPHPAAGSGQVDLIGNPVKLSETPVSYRRAPPMLGADTEAVIAELLGEDAVAQARDAGLLDR